MALMSNPSNYSDWLNRVQSYSASRRAATGRGLSPSELQGMTSGYLEAENARKLESSKAALQAQTQKDISSQNIELQEKGMKGQQEQSMGQGLLSGLGSLGKGYLMNKYLNATAPTTTGATAGILTNTLGNAVPSLTAPAYSLPATEAATGILTTPTLAPAVTEGAGALSTAAPAAAGAGEAATPFISGSGWGTLAMLIRGILGNTIDQPGGEPGGMGRDISSGINNMAVVAEAMKDPTNNARELNNYWQFLNTGSPIGAMPYTEIGEGPYNWVSDFMGL